jgi:hypothetical protein
MHDEFGHHALRHARLIAGGGKHVRAMQRRIGQWLSIAGLVGALASASCGGKSEVEGGKAPTSAGGASAGSASSGGAGNVAGTGSPGSPGEPSTVCPVQKPTMGDYCNNTPDYCSYSIDKCRSLSFECFQHVWLQAPQLDGASFDCNSFPPPVAPKDGDSCECFGLLDCSYKDCSARGQIHAVCDNTSWHVEDTPCPRPPCGPAGFSCNPDQVCLVHPGMVATFACVTNPCGSAATSCDCAASLCTPGEACSVDIGAVSCH